MVARTQQHSLTYPVSNLSYKEMPSGQYPQSLSENIQEQTPLETKGLENNREMFINEPNFSETKEPSSPVNTVVVAL
jgi:hypothetical protein